MPQPQDGLPRRNWVGLASSDWDLPPARSSATRYSSEKALTRFQTLGLPDLQNCASVRYLVIAENELRHKTNILKFAAPRHSSWLKPAALLPLGLN